MQQPPAEPSTSRNVLPMGALVITLMITLGLSYWLVPEQDELVERLIKDHQYARVRETLSSMGGKVEASDLRVLSRNELTMIVTLARLTPRERLNLVFSKSSPPTYNQFIHAMVLADVRYVDVISPSEAWSMIKPQRTRLGGASFTELSTALAHNALSIAKPGLAAEIFTQICELPESTAQSAQEMGITHRWSGQPLLGAQRLRKWLQRHEAARATIIDKGFLGELCSALAVEGSNPSLALDVVEDEIKRLPADQALPPALLERAQSYAAQCNRTSTLVPWIKRYVTSLPESRLSLKALHDSGPSKSGDYKHWITILSQLADWNSAFDEAYEQHLRLAALGSVDSLQRCVALSDFLGRDDETVELLLLVGDVSANPELNLTLADMLASLGRDDEAQPFYEQWLKLHPKDRKVAYALACLLEDEGEEDKAMAAFEQLVEHFPGDVPAVKKLAENYIRADRHQDALSLYAKLKESDHDHYTRENYAMLAESLGDHMSQLSAQLLIARHDDTTQAWLDIAETAAYLKDKSPALAAMTEGLKSKPSSHSVRSALAQLHIESGQIDQAVAVLMHDCTKSHLIAMETLLGLAEDALDRQSILKFVGEDLEKRLPLSVQARLDLAVLCQLGGENERGERLFASVPSAADTQLSIAQARYLAGGYESAAQQMNQYLKNTPRAASEDWVFLGDIYDAMGLEEDAKRAYNQSLTLLTADLPAGQTASSITLPPKSPTQTAP